MFRSLIVFFWLAMPAGILCAQNNRTLATARAGFSTSLIVQKPAPQEYENDKPPAGVREVSYRSGNLTLKAWVSEKPPDEARHPAVLFLHGGFAFGGDDWKDAALFQKAGFVVMVPMLRGENGNPGCFEMFYGEVDDVIAAGKFLAGLPYVNPTNVFVAGHSVGGTLAQLVCMATNQFKAGAAFSGAPNQRTFCRSWAQVVPFSIAASSEIQLRSPIEHPDCVQVQLFLYAGDEESGYVNDNSLLARQAQKLGKPVTFKQIPGDHFSALPGEIADAIKQFKAMTTAPANTPPSTK